MVNCDSHRFALTRFLLFALLALSCGALDSPQSFLRTTQERGNDNSQPVLTKIEEGVTKIELMKKIVDALKGSKPGEAASDIAAVVFGDDKVATFLSNASANRKFTQKDLDQLKGTFQSKKATTNGALDITSFGDLVESFNLTSLGLPVTKGKRERAPSKGLLARGKGVSRAEPKIGILGIGDGDGILDIPVLLVRVMAALSILPVALVGAAAVGVVALLSSGGGSNGDDNGSKGKGPSKKKSSSTGFSAADCGTDNTDSPGNNAPKFGLLGIGDGDGVLEVPVSMVRMMVTAIIVPVAVVGVVAVALLVGLAAGGGGDGGGDGGSDGGSGGSGGGYDNDGNDNDGGLFGGGSRGSGGSGNDGNDDKYGSNDRSYGSKEDSKVGDRLRINRMRSKSNLVNENFLPARETVAQLVRKTINNLSHTLDTSSLNASALTDEVLSILKTLNMRN